MIHLCPYCYLLSARKAVAGSTMRFRCKSGLVWRVPSRKFALSDEKAAFDPGRDQPIS